MYVPQTHIDVLIFEPLTIVNSPSQRESTVFIYTTSLILKFSTYFGDHLKCCRTSLPTHV